MLRGDDHDPLRDGAGGGPVARCRGRTDLFFAPPGERPEWRDAREAAARALCLACPLLEPCRALARSQREYGFWGGESEAERAEAGYPVSTAVGRPLARPRPRRRTDRPVVTV